ncbi:MAG: anion permease [Gemmatimonadetes bacterium]|nr:anion permease [Gemmatimonadota bacterium]
MSHPSFHTAPARSPTPGTASPSRVRFGRLVAALIVGTVLWHMPVPTGVDPRAWHLLAIFVATIVGIILRPLPMGATALVAVALTVLTGTLTIAQGMSGFSSPVVWLVVAAFFLSVGFIRTGLGVRIAYHFLRVLGRTTLGLGYGLVATDLVLAPVIPSNAARAGGVVFPILRSLGASLGSEAASGTERRISSFLTVVAYQGTCITSAMFLTSMAANPMAAELAGRQGVEITWARWALASLVPGALSLILIPLLIFRLYPPQVRETSEAPALAKRRLQEMGRMSGGEWVLTAVFVLLLALWTFGDRLGLNTTAVALGGVGALLLTGTVRWEDLLEERSAWDTLTWFAVLIMMANQLAELGLAGWFSGRVAGVLGDGPWLPAFLGLSLAYFYSHYFFASNTAHVVAMYAPFLAVALAVGTPPLLAALVLGFFSSLFAGMTHYGTAPGPMFFGSGNVELGTWWKLGAVVSVANVIIWLGVGSLWWKVLGLW